MLLWRATTSGNLTLVLGVATWTHQSFPGAPEAAGEEEAKQGACSKMRLVNGGGNEYPPPKQGVESESSQSRLRLSPQAVLHL